MMKLGTLATIACLTVICSPLNALAEKAGGNLGTVVTEPKSDCSANLPDNKHCSCTAFGHPPICQTIRQEDEASGDVWYYAYCKGDSGTIICVGDEDDCNCGILGNS